jgi:hypothetical protein
MTAPQESLGNTTYQQNLQQAHKLQARSLLRFKDFWVQTNSFAVVGDLNEDVQKELSNGKAKFVGCFGKDSTISGADGIVMWQVLNDWERDHNI